MSVAHGAGFIIIGKVLDMLLPKLALVTHQLKQLAIEHQDVPRLSNTQKQPAQPTKVIASSLVVYLLRLMRAEVGKRACIWIHVSFNLHMAPAPPYPT